MSDISLTDSSPTASALPLGSRTRRTANLTGFSIRPTRDEGLVVGHRYEVEAFLGEGGTATVYVARDSHTDHLVVIKRMKPEISSTPELRKRFVLEARALACVDHPCVVQVLDIDEPEEEPPYLALEALRGETLGDYLKRHEVMGIDMTVRLMRQAAEALEAVHAAGIVHRDIKPDNLFLVGPIGNPHGIKVLDFGMARLSDETYDENSTSILGTAQYMAPEQILVEPVDARTDAYALGVVMFRMLTGHLPFDANSKDALLRHQLFSPVPPVSWLHEDIPEMLENIVHRATRKSPDARFEAMADFKRALDVFAGMDDPPPSRRARDIDLPQEDDVYTPVSQRGRHAATVLAAEFGIYSRPHSPPPPPAHPPPADASPPPVDAPPPGGSFSASSE